MMTQPNATEIEAVAHERSLRSQRHMGIGLLNLGAFILLMFLFFSSNPPPVESQAVNYFSVLRAYWGLDQPIEVSSGDTASLSLLLRYGYQYSVRGMEAELVLPEGFMAVGGGRRAMAHYTGTISSGSIIKLDFPIFIAGAGKGGYTAYLQLSYEIPELARSRNEVLEVYFEVTGKPSIRITSMGSSLSEGFQEMRILIKNDGDAVAESLRAVKVYSSSAPVEVLGSSNLGRLEPGGMATLPVEVYVPSSLKGGLLTLSVEVNCNGPSGVSYTFSRSLLIPVEAGKSIVTGRAISEEGLPLGDLLVEIYSSDGAFIGRVQDVGYISPDGRFSASLTLGSYSIQFSKEGYSKVTKNVSLKSAGEIINLGDIEISRSIRLSTSTLSLSANAGDKLLLPFTVRNLGEQAETLNLNASSPEGWQVRILGQEGRVVNRVELLSGSSLNLQAEIAVPATAKGVNNLTLTAYGKIASHLTLTVNVEPTGELIASCQYPGKVSTVGDIVRFQVNLKNPLGARAAFRVYVDSLPPNWSASVKSPTGEYLTQVTLEANQALELIVEVTSPTSAKMGEEYGLVFRAESMEGNLRVSLPLRVTLTQVEEDVKFYVKSPEVTVEAGKTIKYPITIINSGGVDRLLSFNVEPPSDWKVVFKYGELEVTGLYLGSKSSETLVIEATPPSTVNVGEYSIPVRVISERGVKYAEIGLKATIVGSYSLGVEASTLLTSLQVGGSTTLRATVTNKGYTTLTGLRLSVEAPSGWEVSVTPTLVEALRPRESYSFNIVLKTAGDTVAGDYMVTLKGLSDQASSDPVQVRVTATVPTSWGLIGVGVAAFMVILLFLAFRRFRRR
ncbi:MAG: NEW3 domain-containing protein [Candidatus Bathyarchaeia archaeon]